VETAVKGQRSAGLDRQVGEEEGSFGMAAAEIVHDSCGEHGATEIESMGE
jgi:hypothetical protein